MADTSRRIVYNRFWLVFESSERQCDRRADLPAQLAYAYAVSGRRSEAVKILNELKNPSEKNAYEIALIYVGLAEKDQAMTWLEKAYEERSNPSILLRPAFDPVRSDPPFQDLVRRLGLKHGTTNLVTTRK